MELWFTFFEWAVAAIVILATLLYFKKNSKDPRYPPGPRSIPFFGNVLQIGKDPLPVFQKWAEKYGPIYSIRMGTEDTVVLNDPKLVKELFSHSNSTGRPSNFIIQYFREGTGVALSEGHTWEAQRSFTLKNLRDFGVLNKSNEGFLMEEAGVLIKFLERQVGKPITGTHLFIGPVVNGLWRIITGENIEWESEVKPEILERAEQLFVSLNKVSLLPFAPFLRHIAPNYLGWTGWKNAVESFFELMRKAVETHSQRLDPNSPMDFIDHYLVKIGKTTDPTSTFYQETGVKNLEVVLGDVFLAASFNTSTTLSFAILYLILNKQIEQIAQQELDRVVGSSRPVSLKDRTLLPYTEAILLETLRLSNIAPLGIPHRMTADTIFNGYFLPKGVTVIAGLHTIHHDPKIWGDDVNEFRPERFLNEEKTQVIHHEALVAFSAGKRVCLGEGFARDILFLFIASILQRFNIEHDPDNPVRKIETVNGLGIEPKPFKFVLSFRN